MKFLSISFILLFSLILLRFYSTRPVYQNGDNIRITSRVYNEPIIYDRQQYLNLQGLKVYLPKYPQITYGDLIQVEGIVEDDKLKQAKLINLQTETKNLLLKLRLKLISFYKSSLPEPYGSLMAGIVIGSKNMPPSFWQRLKKTGTAHVVVASGTNVTMFAAFLISTLTYFFNRKHAVFIAIAGILLYVILSGFDAPIIRAGIMASITFWAQKEGRVVNSWRLLIYTAGIMLLIKPHWITDLGFILSFMATMSLMLFQKRIDMKLKFVPEIVREGLSTSLAAQIGVAFIIYATFGQFNFMSPIINALILWTVPYIMSIGALAGIASLIAPFIGRLILFISFPLLLWFTKILEIF